jgi:hypothetical protein
MCDATRSPMSRPALLAAFALVLTGGMLPGLRAADPATPAEAHKPIGHLVTQDGTLFARRQPDKPWRMIPEKGTVESGDLLFGLPFAALETGKGAARLMFLTDLDKLSPYPILEAAVVLHDTPGFDLDFTLDRGRVDVTNLKEKGSARVRIRFHDQTWEATLEDPGTKIALELYGRWAKGVKFTTTPGPKDVPSAALAFLVRKGHVQLKHGSCEHAMSAPPGPALLHWDNSATVDEAPQKLNVLPEWADTDESTSERALRIKKVIEDFRQAAAKKPIEQALEEFVTSDNPNHRATGVIYMGATDNLDGLAKVLATTKYLDAWDRAVVVIRHWIGRCPGQDQIIYRGLIEKRGYTPAHAETIMQLLHSFGDEDLAQPELYKMLVRFLDQESLGIRGLAYWHLSRLVPAGKEFGYNPLDPKEKRDKARAQWKKLVEDLLARGKLAPRPETPPRPAKN